MLASYAFKRAVLDVSEDANTTIAIEIAGYRVVSVITPGTLDGATNDIQFSVDPGDGTFRIVRDDAGTALELTNVGTNEHLLVPEGFPPIVGARLQLQLSEDEDADRVFLVQVVALSGREE